MNAADDTLGTGTGRKIVIECLAGFICLPRRYLEAIMNTDPSDLEDAVDIFDIPLHMSLIAIFSGRYLLLGQKPGQGSHHSTSHSPYNVVKGRRVFLSRFELVKSLNASVYTIEYWFFESLNEGFANWALYSSNGNSRCMDELSHLFLLWYEVSGWLIQISNFVSLMI
jgi:hypothetical protein